MYQLVKVKRFPAVHVLERKFVLSADSTLNAKQATIVPIAMQDEGKGDPTSLYTNPESASFAEVNEPNCYPDSKINFAKINVELGISKQAYSTDSIEVLKVMVFPIFTSFLENLTALNDVTSEEVEDILELQHETTDRQTYPLWNGTKLNGDFVETGSNVPGLTTNTNIEGVNIDVNKIYDALQFYTNGGKIRKSIGKIKWLNVSRKRNLRLSFRIKSKTKRMNPYTFLGLAVVLPAEDDYNQVMKNGDMTAIDHLHVKVSARYNEWNENFNAMR